MRGPWPAVAFSALLLAAAAGAAHANGLVYLGYWMLLLFLGFLVVVIVVSALIEAAAYRLVAGLHYWRALGTAFAASTASTVAVAALLSVDALAYLGPAGFALLGALALLAVELPIVWLMNRAFPQRERLLCTALVTNLVLYAVGVVALLQSGW
jgi:hypothetical protein